MTDFYFGQIRLPKPLSSDTMLAMSSVTTFKKPNPMRTRKIVIFAILTAIIFLMAFTPLGYLSIGVVSITFLMIPVIIGAATLGPLGGMGLGFVFGVTSFIGCFGFSTFTTLLFNINPWLTALNLFFPRMLFGLVAGLLYKLFKKTIKNEIASDVLTMLLAAILHTTVFVSIFYVAFSRDPAFASYNQGFFAMIWAMFGLNATVEWAVCAVFGTAILKTLVFFLNRHDKKKEAQKEQEQSSALSSAPENNDDDDDDIGTLILASQPTDSDDNASAPQSTQDATQDEENKPFEPETIEQSADSL